MLLHHTQEHRFSGDCNLLTPVHQSANFVCMPFYKAIKTSASSCSSTFSSGCFSSGSRSTAMMCTHVKAKKNSCSSCESNTVSHIQSIIIIY